MGGSEVVGSSEKTHSGRARAGLQDLCSDNLDLQMTMYVYVCIYSLNFQVHADLERVLGVGDDGWYTIMCEIVGSNCQHTSVIRV